MMAWGAGALAWCWFLGFGAIPFGLLDWRQEHFYYSVLQSALRTATIPWHVTPVFHFTDRFLASPLPVLAPHILLLRWVPLPSFVLVHVVACHTIGFLGCVRLASRCRLGWPAFLALVLLFNFNGYPASRLCAGHTVWWAGYFLLPWLWAPLLRWAESGPTAARSAEVALVMFAMSLFGSFHLCAWSVLVIALLGVRRTGWLLPSAGVIGGAGLLLAYRLIPGIAGFGRLAHGVPVGYPAWGDWLAGLVALRPPTWPTLNAMGWWEYDVYIGPVGFLFLLVFAVWPLVRDRRASTTVFDLPVVGLALLAYGDVYWWTLSDVPVLAVERVVSRLLVMPVALLSVLAAIRLDSFMRRRRIPDWIAWSGLALLAVPLLVHFAMWRPGLLADRTPGGWITPALPVIANRPDAPYQWSVVVGWVVTLAALAAAIRIMRGGELTPRQRRHHGKVVR
jgi:hypothetical protein